MLKNLVDYGVFDNILYVCVIFHILLLNMIVVFSFATFSSACFYVIARNQECFHMNKIRNIMGKMESDFDMVDYDDWTFMNSVFYMN